MEAPQYLLELDDEIENRFTDQDLKTVEALEQLFIQDRAIEDGQHYLKFDERAFEEAVSNLKEFLVHFRHASISENTTDLAYNFRFILRSSSRMEAFVDTATDGLIGILKLTTDTSLREEVPTFPEEILDQTGVDLLMQAWCKISQDAYIKRASVETSLATQEHKEEDENDDILEIGFRL